MATIGSEDAGRLCFARYAWVGVTLGVEMGGRGLKKKRQIVGPFS